MNDVSFLIDAPTLISKQENTKEEIVEELCRIGGINGGHKGGSNAVETHKFNKTGLWSDDHWIQKLGAATGAGGKASSKNQQLNKIGIFGYSKEEKSIVSKLGGYAVGRQNGLKLKETKKGIFNPEKKKEWSSMGGKVQKGYKKHRNEDGRWAMARRSPPRTDPVNRNMRLATAKGLIRRSVRPLSISNLPSSKQCRKKSRWLMA